MFYWSLWTVTEASMVLQARPINQAINHVYLCVDQKHCNIVSGNILEPLSLFFPE